MSHLLDDEEVLPRRHEREVTLSSGAILGIFFGLALLCALFFGFGYNMGHKATPVATAASDSPYEGGATSSYAFSGAKPSAGSSASAAPFATGTPASPTDMTNVVGAPAHSPSAPAATPATTVITRTETTVPAHSEPADPAPVAHGSFAAGNFVVQVAAVSHQEDAELLVNALRRKGYSVVARNESADKLVHIQVGPFNDHKEADTMRLKLAADGYNAMIKQI